MELEFSLLLLSPAIPWAWLFIALVWGLKSMRGFRGQVWNKEHTRNRKGEEMRGGWAESLPFYRRSHLLPLGGATCNVFLWAGCYRAGGDEGKTESQRCCPYKMSAVTHLFHQGASRSPRRPGSGNLCPYGKGSFGCRDTAEERLWRHREKVAI